MSPEGDFRLPPCQKNVGMMALFFGQSSDSIDEIERLFEIGEAEGTMQVMLVDYIPAGNLFVKILEFVAFERRNTATAGNAGSFG